MRLATILAAAALSTGFACDLEPPYMEPEPRGREERIEWRTRFGVHAAQSFIFDDCVASDDLADELAHYGTPYGLSGRDVAESIYWGMLREPSQLPPSDAPTIDTYLDEAIDRYGERFLDVTHVLFSHGPYDRTIHWFFLPSLEKYLAVETPDALRGNVGSGLTVARWFFDVEATYASMQNAWNGSRRDSSRGSRTR